MLVGNGTRRLGLAMLALALVACGSDGGSPAGDGVQVTDAGADADVVVRDVAGEDGVSPDTGCTTDEDGDGVVAASCGGTDCDDSDRNRYPGNAEVCDAMGHDEDCDCADGADRGCPARGVCASGRQRCVRGRWGMCSISPSPEICNGLDDNCDGTTDELTVVPMGTALPPEAITATACGGLLGGRCSSGACRCPAGQEGCGGTCRVTGAACTVGVGGCARSGRQLCGASGTAVVCSSAPGAPVVAGAPTTETCNDVDDNCDGAVDEGLHTGGGISLNNDGSTVCRMTSCSEDGFQRCTSARFRDGICNANAGYVTYTPGLHVGATCLTLPTTGPEAVPVHRRVTYGELNAFFESQCNRSISDNTGGTAGVIACRRRAHQRCVGLGHLTGFLSRNSGEDFAYLTCLRAPHALVVTVPLPSTEFSTYCTRGYAVDYCSSEVSAACRARGFRGGYGPVDVTATSITYVCIRSF